MLQHVVCGFKKKNHCTNIDSDLQVSYCSSGLCMWVNKESRDRDRDTETERFPQDKNRSNINVHVCHVETHTPSAHLTQVL